jgi:tetratricopeptide (TPR) repeat protein
MATTTNQRTQTFAGLRALGCLLLGPLCLATALSASRPTGARTELANQPGVPAPAPETRLQAQLWSSRIAAPEPNEDVQTQLALKRLIRQIRSVRFDNRGVTPTPRTPAQPQVPAPRPERKPVVAPTEAPADSRPTAQEVASARTAAAILKTRPDPNRVHDPLELAELLYLSGRPTDAAPFYQKALDDLGADDPATEADRAWILFQLGNCLRESDGAKAQEVYAKLTSRFPNSPWTEMARAHGRILSWYQKTQPQQWIASGKP